MKKKLTIYLFSVVFSRLCLSQNIEIQYKAFLFSGEEDTFVLNCNAQSSFFYRLQNNQNNEPKIDENGILSIVFQPKRDTIPHFIKNEFGNDTLTLLKKDETKNTFLTVKDIKSKIKWSLQKEEKQIGKYNCKKAIGDFRGRKYIVWFTEELAINSGPFKLHGLPGLIVEAIDETKQIYYRLSKVSYNKNFNFNRFNSVLKKYNTISYKEYTVIEKKNRDEILKRLFSKLPARNTSLLNTKSNSIELKYEWEEEKEETKKD